MKRYGWYYANSDRKFRPGMQFVSVDQANRYAKDRMKQFVALDDPGPELSVLVIPLMGVKVVLRELDNERDS